MRFPLLDFYLEIPFVAVSTEILASRDAMREFEYVALYGKIFKWKFRFRLYDTWRRRLKEVSDERP